MMDKDECEKCVRFQRGNCSLNLPPPKKWCFHFIEYEGNRMIPNTWAEGLNPKSTPMDQKRSELFVMAVMAEMQQQALKKEVLENLFEVQILNKRIEVYKLPIQFNDYAKMSLTAFCNTPGALIALLIDCLNKYEGQTVTCSMLADLYPMGFYDEPSLTKYIDEYLKTRKVKWSEIY